MMASDPKKQSARQKEISQRGTMDERTHGGGGADQTVLTPRRHTSQEQQRSISYRYETFTRNFSEQGSEKSRCVSKDPTKPCERSHSHNFLVHILA